MPPLSLSLPVVSPAGTSSVRRQGEAGQYRRPSSVPVLAQAWGVRPTTAKQQSNPADPRCPWMRAAVGTEALMRAGLVRRAEELCGPLDRARLLLVAPVDRAMLHDALVEEQEHDGLEDVAQVALISGLTSASLDTYLRRAEKYAAVLARTIRLGRAYLEMAR